MINRQSIDTYQTDQLLDTSQNIDTPLIINEVQTIEPPTIDKKPTQRLNSLDVLRGLTMLGMILVDNQGPTPPWFLDHAQWNGLTPADLIFPSFLFIMGMAVPLSMSAKKPFSVRNLIRIIALFAIGVFINLSARKFTFNHFRIVGILQRLSLAYGALSLIHVLTRYGKKSFRIIGLIISAIFAAIYLGLMLTFQNNDIGCPHSQNLSPFCNFGSYLDRAILTKLHMIYPNDPEGFFTTLTAYLNAYAGYWFCLLMQDNKNNSKKTVIFWSIISVISLLIAWPSTYVMPLNKKIWSISFVFGTIGVSGLSLVILTLLVDILKKQSRRYEKVVGIITAPFVWLGRNPLAIFILMDAVAIIMIDYIIINEKSAWYYFYHYGFKSWISNTYICSTVFAVFFAILWTSVSGIMFKKNLFLRL